MSGSFIDATFPHRWQAEVLAARPVILPARHFVYPREVEEVERGALEVLIRPDAGENPSLEGTPNLNGASLNQYINQAEPDRPLSAQDLKGTGFSPYINQPEPGGALAPEGRSSNTPTAAQPFLATCAVGFRDPVVPTGLWSTPKPEEICAVSGGYAYLIDTTAPARFTMIPFRPVLEVRPLRAERLLLFVGHHAILAWGENGEAWRSERLSSEGVTVTGVEGGILRGLGWDLMTDKETPFALDARTGSLITTGHL